MNLKKWKILSVFIIFGLSSLFHFIYTWFPSFMTSLFFPVNESIWEHNKIIMLSFLMLALIEKLYKKSKNTLFAGLISGIACSLIVMIIFTPIFLYILKTKDNIIVTFIVYFIAIIISEIISYKILKNNYNKKLETIALILWPLIFILNGVLTYYPLNDSIFCDYSKKTYGIPLKQK